MAFRQRVAKTLHTIVPDRMATSKKSVKIQTVGDKHADDRRHSHDRAASAAGL
jgi:hypothetical protein